MEARTICCSPFISVASVHLRIIDRFLVVLAPGINTKDTDTNGRNGLNGAWRFCAAWTSYAALHWHPFNSVSFVVTLRPRRLVPHLEMILADYAMEHWITAEMQHQANLHRRCAEVAEQLG